MRQQMKKVKLLVSQNGWEYTGKVVIDYNETYELVYPDDIDEFALDSMGHPATKIIIVDGVKIEFDEVFELSGI